MSGNSLERVARLTLSPKDEALVRKSRAHWARMWKDPEGCKEKPNADDCALCGEYLTPAATCGSCPVSLVTGRILCGGTPYADACTVHTTIRLRTTHGTEDRRLAVLAFQEAAARMVAWIDEHLLALRRERRSSMVDAYADVGWSATAISLSLARIEQERSISRDRETLETVAGAIDNFAQGAYEQEAGIPLFSQIEGLLVFVRTVSEWNQPPADGDIRQRAGNLAVMLRGFLSGSGEGAGQGKLLRKFFRKVHDVAEEVTATGLPADPVVEVFGALAQSRRTASTKEGGAA